jgi:hypothetical protein
LVKILSKPSSSACFLIKPEPGTTRHYISSMCERCSAMDV